MTGSILLFLSGKKYWKYISVYIIKEGRSNKEKLGNEEGNKKPQVGRRFADRFGYRIRRELRRGSS